MTSWAPSSGSWILAANSELEFSFVLPMVYKLWSWMLFLQHTRWECNSTSPAWGRVLPPSLIFSSFSSGSPSSSAALLSYPPSLFQSPKLLLFFQLRAAAVISSLWWKTDYHGLHPQLHAFEFRPPSEDRLIRAGREMQAHPCCTVSVEWVLLLMFSGYQRSTRQTSDMALFKNAPPGFIHHSVSVEFLCRSPEFHHLHSVQLLLSVLNIK